MYTSFANHNCHSHQNPDGTYSYNFNNEVPTSITIEPGLDGVTADMIEELIKLDHNERLGDRREADHRNTKYDYSYSNSDIIANQMDKISYYVYLSNANNDGPPSYISKLAEYVPDAIASLSLKDQEVFRRYFGERDTLETIAKDFGVTKQAIHKRINKIKKSVMDYLETYDTDIA